MHTLVKKRESIGNNHAKNWKPIHSDIVMMRLVQGLSLTEVSDITGFSESHISNICRSKKALAMVADINQRVLNERYENLTDQTKSMMVLAAERLKDFLMNDAIQKSAPVACVAENVKILNALVAMQKGPAVSPTGNTYINNTQVNVMSDPEKRDALAAGLEEAKRVESLHASTDYEKFDIRPKEIAAF